MSRIADHIVAIHVALDAAALPHAFGGALALAWCTGDPRGTSDIDLNVFVAPSRAGDVLGALPAEVRSTAAQRKALGRDGQTRLWWGDVPVDVFLSTAPFHDHAAGRAKIEPFLGVGIPFLDCGDLAVFKAFFNRTRDWADLEDMARAGTIDRAGLAAAISALLGDDDERLVRIEQLPW